MASITAMNVKVAAPANLSSKARTGLQAKAAPVPKAARAASPAVCFSFENPMKKAAAVSLAAAIAVAAPAFPAKAGLTEDLLARSEANKELNDKKRAATSSANFGRSRTVTDGTCYFPNNMLGCENYAEVSGKVKFLSDDLKIECEGTQDGKICASKATGSLPSPFGL